MVRTPQQAQQTQLKNTLQGQQAAASGLYTTQHIVAIQGQGPVTQQTAVQQQATGLAQGQVAQQSAVQQSAVQQATQKNSERKTVTCNNKDYTQVFVEYGNVKYEVLVRVSEQIMEGGKPTKKKHNKTKAKKTKK